jgi:hypothetical protein
VKEDAMKRFLWASSAVLLMVASGGIALAGVGSSPRGAQGQIVLVMGQFVDEQDIDANGDGEFPTFGDYNAFYENLFDRHGDTQLRYDRVTCVVYPEEFLCHGAWSSTGAARSM